MHPKVGLSCVIWFYPLPSFDVTTPKRVLVAPLKILLVRVIFIPTPSWIAGMIDEALFTSVHSSSNVPVVPADDFKIPRTISVLD